MPTGIYRRVKPSWNKGLTKENNSGVAKYSKAREGTHLSKETKEKLSKILKGNSRRKGKPCSIETKRRMSLAQKGKPSLRKGIPHSQETRKRISEQLKGRHISKETLQKRSTLKGIKAPNWRGGISSKNLIIRGCVEYRLWREAVYARDGWTCQECGDNSVKNMNAHHIKSFAKFPELHFAIDNGVTLCKKCHRKIKTGTKKEEILCSKT